MEVNKAILARMLDGYAATWGAGMFDYRGLVPEFDKKQTHLFRRFLEAHENPFVRECLPGHFTGSAILTDTTLEKVLLTHHKKLKKWLQLGGHADGDFYLENVALKEVHEESGISDLSFLPYEAVIRRPSPTPLPFDLDIHLIPGREQEPKHYHYDLRFLIVANEPDAIQISDESNDLRWFFLDEARHMTSDENMLRQFNKFEAIRAAMRGKGYPF